MSRHPAAMSDEQLTAACDVRRGRGRGPGGQHRNKVETAVIFHHRPTGIEAGATERRSQVENHRVALKRLRRELAVAVREEPDLRAGPSELWRSRVQGGRIVLNPDHHDFALMLAEALDHITHFRFDIAKAAEWLACTPTQLVKLLKHDPRALEQVNEGRRKRGMRAMK